MTSRRVALAILVLMVAVTGSPGPLADAAEPEGGSADWRSVSAGRNHTCGIRTSGRLYCWGEDIQGQLGNGPGPGSDSPVEVVGNHTDWKVVSAGGNHTCARRATGRLYCWGSDSNGQVGDDGDNVAQTVPVQVFGNRIDWTNAISAGERHTCARRTTGRLYCWGDDGNGQVGNGGLPAEHDTPQQVFGNLTTWTAVSAGDFHTCARRSTGRLYCWGSDDPNGTLGNNATLASQGTPVQVFGNRTDWAAVSAGGDHTCARRTSGRIFCWGADNFGQVGNGAATGIRPTPTAVGTLADWTSVSAGETHTCGRRTNGRAYCWGRAAFGALGDNQTLTDRVSPTQVFGAVTTWTGPEAGSNHSCARRTDRRLYCWGNDNSGQMGNGPPPSNLPTPSQVL